jgi:hypothetical protein
MSKRHHSISPVEAVWDESKEIGRFVRGIIATVSRVRCLPYLVFAVVIVFLLVAPR